MSNKRAFKKGERKKKVKRAKAMLFFCLAAAVLIFLIFYLNDNGQEIGAEGYGQLANLPASGNLIQVNETDGAVITTFQSTAVIGQPVKWKKQIVPKEEGSLTVEIPKQAENIGINKVKENTETDAEASIMTGEAVKGSGSVPFYYLLKDAARKILLGITGKTIDGIEINMRIDEQDAEYYIEYETPAPQATEISISENEKQIIISAPDNLGYKDILAFTSLTKEVSHNNLKLYHEVDGIKERVEIRGYDKNNNNLIDYVEWNVPHLSEQSYLLIIEISKAEHLDENREFVSDIFNEVVKQDGIWSEEINNNEYVRATFEQPLDNEKDITLHARASGGGEARVEVYISGTNTKIAEFENITKENTYKVYLTALPEGENYETFDLKVLGKIELDYIVDPTSSCTGNAAVCSGLSQGSCGATAGVPQYGCSWQGCTGTATSCGSLSSSTCGNQGGCNWYGCTGSATSCNSLDSSQPGCTGQDGCSWEACYGGAKACSSLVTQPACTGQGGCSWDACEGTIPSSCTDHSDESECYLLGCSWESSGDYCYGYTNDCDYYDSNPTNCGTVGCNWYGCTGSAYTCDYYDSNSAGCSGHDGCSWEECMDNPYATSCDYYSDSSSCTGQGGCNWDGCTGTATACSGLPQGSCGATVSVPQYGCAWSGCTGTATQCYNLNSSASNCSSQSGCSYNWNEECTGVYISGAGCGGNVELGNAVTITYGATCQPDPLSSFKYTNLGLYEGVTELSCSHGTSTGDCVTTGDSSYTANWTAPLGAGGGSKTYYADCYASAIDAPACSQGTSSCAITWVDTTDPIINVLSSSSSDYICSETYEFSAYVYDLNSYEWFFTGGSPYCSDGGASCTDGLCSISCSELSAGIYNQHWSASDNALNTADEYPTFTINKIVPTADLTGNPGWTINQGTLFTIGYGNTNLCNDGDVLFNIYRSGVDVGLESWTPSCGTYNYLLNTTGGDNFLASAVVDSATLTVNGAVPSASITSVGGDTTAPYSTGSSPSLVLSTTANAYCRWSDSASDTYETMGSCGGLGTSHTCSLGSWANGPHTVYYACGDVCGNNGSASPVSFTVDITPPSVSIDSISGDSNEPFSISDSSPDPTVSTNDPTAVCKASLTQSSYENMESSCGIGGGSCSLGSLSDGSYTVYAGCGDSVGNNATTSASVEIDTVAPTQSGHSPASGSTIYTDSPTITFNTDEDATCRWALTDLDYSAMVNDCSGGGTSHSCAVSGLAGSIDYVYIACADDTDVSPNAQTASTNNELGFYLLQLNVSLSKGWNLFSVISNYSNDGTDRNVTVQSGWNLIGYSSNMSLNLSYVLFTNASGNRSTWQQAIRAKKVQAYLVYRENNRYKYVGLQNSGMHDYALRPGKAYWLYANQSGIITLPGVGGSVPQTTGETFSFANLLFHNGTSLATLTDAYNTYDWVFLDESAIYFRNVTDNIYYHSCSFILGACKKTTISPWEGYFIWSDYNNITMIVYP